MKTRVLCSVMFLKNYAVYEVMWKNVLETYRPEVTMENCACSLHAGYVRLQAYTQDINTYYLPTATMVTQMHISGMFIPTLPVMLFTFLFFLQSPIVVWKMKAPEKKPLVRPEKPEEVRAKVRKGSQKKVQNPIKALSEFQSPTESI